MIQGTMKISNVNVLKDILTTFLLKLILYKPIDIIRLEI